MKTLLYTLSMILAAFAVYGQPLQHNPVVHASINKSELLYDSKAVICVFPRTHRTGRKLKTAKSDDEILSHCHQCFEILRIQKFSARTKKRIATHTKLEPETEKLTRVN